MTRPPTLPPGRGAVSARDLPAGDQRDRPPDRRPGEIPGPADRRGEHGGPRPDGPRQPASRGQHRPRLHRQGAGPPGPDRGREPRSAASGRGLRSHDEHPLQHLRQLLDQAVDQAGPGEHGQDDPHPRYMVELLAKWRRATNKLNDELGRPPTHEEVARFMGLPKKSSTSSRRPSASTTPRRSPTRASRWSIDEMLQDASKTPDTEMVETDDLKHAALPGQNGQARGHRAAHASVSTMRNQRPSRKSASAWALPANESARSRARLWPSSGIT